MISRNFNTAYTPTSRIRNRKISYTYYIWERVELSLWQYTNIMWLNVNKNDDGADMSFDVLSCIRITEPCLLDVMENFTGSNAFLITPSPRIHYSYTKTAPTLIRRPPILQNLLTSGSPPCVVQQLAALPLRYFSRSEHAKVLMPALLACCTLSEPARNLLHQEVSQQVRK